MIQYLIQKIFDSLSLSTADELSEATVSMSTDSTENSIVCFHHFPQLPLELRRKIFDHALPLFERIVEVEPIYHAIAARKALQYVRIRVSSGPTLLQINHETREELVKHYSCPFSIEIGDVASLMINWRFDKLFMNTRDQSQIYRFQPGLHAQIGVNADLFQPLAEIFSLDGYIEMQRNMRCLAGTCEGWIDTLQRYHLTRQRCLLFAEFTALEELLIIQPGKDDKPPSSEDPWAPGATRPIRDVRNGPSLSPQGWTSGPVMGKKKKVVGFKEIGKKKKAVGFEENHVTDHRWLSWEGAIAITMPGLLYAHVLIIRD